MAEYVLVKNLGSKTYKEEFKGKMITIEPKKTVSMIRNEAVQFLGSIGSSNPDKGVEKNLEIIRGAQPKEDVEKPVFISHLDGQSFDTQEELDLHLKMLNPEEKGAAVIEDEDVDSAQKRKKLLKG